jgi:predicted Zn-dependent protease
MEVGGIALDREGTIYDYGEIGPFGVANSTGLFRYGKLTQTAFEVSARKGEGAGRVRKSSMRVAEIDAGAVTRDACDRVEASLNPRDLDPGKYTVIFEDEAVKDLAFFLGYLGFNGLSVAEGRSPLAGKLGEKVFGDNITFREDPGHPDLNGLGFDGEGVDSKKMDIIRDGVVSGFYHDRRSAFLMGHEATGHGLPAPNSWGAFARYPVMDGGEASLEEMVAGLDHGVLVTRLWYTNVVDPMRLIVTGMTRDGTFLVEDGKIVGAVKNFRFNQSLLDLFQNVEQLGRVASLGETVLPHLRVKDFNFSSSTDF